MIDEVHQEKAEADLRRSNLYLLLGLGFRFTTPPKPSRTPKVICSLRKPAVKIRPALLLANDEKKQQWMWHGTEHGRLALEFSRPSNTRENVMRVVSAIEALFTHLHRMKPENFTAYQVPKALFREQIFREEHLLALEELVSHLDGYAPFGLQRFHDQLGTFIMIPDIELGWLFYLLPTVLESPPLFDACSFFQECSREYTFLGDVVTEILENPSEGPEHQRERVAVEGVVLSAFRCIEALVGEPGRRERFRKRLADCGINYDDLVGFGGTAKRPLGERLYWLQELRDATSAHGRRRRTDPVTFAECMEAQYLAESVLHQVLWHVANRRGRPEGSDQEIGLLLQAMYPAFDDPRWPLRRFPGLGGKRAVDVVRKPDGLKELAALKQCSK